MDIEAWVAVPRDVISEGHLRHCDRGLASMFFGVQLPWCKCVGLNDGVTKAFLAFEKQVAEVNDLFQLNTS
jgi:hypothetical protein